MLLQLLPLHLPMLADSDKLPARAACTVFFEGQRPPQDTATQHRPGRHCVSHDVVGAARKRQHRWCTHPIPPAATVTSLCMCLVLSLLLQLCGCLQLLSLPTCSCTKLLIQTHSQPGPHALCPLGATWPSHVPSLDLQLQLEGEHVCVNMCVHAWHCHVHMDTRTTDQETHSTSTKLSLNLICSLLFAEQLAVCDVTRHSWRVTRVTRRCNCDTPCHECWPVWRNETSLAIYTCRETVSELRATTYAIATEPTG
jgi:hypothetical protein